MGYSDLPTASAAGMRLLVSYSIRESWSKGGCAFSSRPPLLAIGGVVRCDPKNSAERLAETRNKTTLSDRIDVDITVSGSLVDAWPFRHPVCLDG